ncbi:4Fe-4S dicluster domain-containing protein [Ferrimonas aestuarii]|uniref:Formate dehydrogenase iron-sulfur subunit n=1 Tax=Ferrimonas aestuarii TaxID=2569539 RepID=A0A4U1BNB1_9GAMM|nr:4Fe-4S dicluster domain-containing protein [Ferrimonas aestuarii]TKB54972.1 4Fe-4S dicluster domain-containing protein [Ferrimonas aestuarii]
MSSLDVIQISGTSEDAKKGNPLNDVQKVAKLFDATKCNGCKACQVACSEWNDLRADVGSFQGSYQNPASLSDQCWTLMQYNEVMDNNKLRWQFTHTACMHCEDPACLKACSTKGAIVKLANGTVQLNDDKCIGCGYCVSACPFDVPKLDSANNKARKCTMCIDRLQVGLEPACTKTCTTGALRFGTREDMLFQAELRVKALKEKGHHNAGIYNPEGVSGTGMIMVLHDINKPDTYGLPAKPTTPLSVDLRQDWIKPLGAVGLLATAAVACIHKVTVGRNIVEEEEAEHGAHTQEEEK